MHAFKKPAVAIASTGLGLSALLIASPAHAAFVNPLTEGHYDLAAVITCEPVGGGNWAVASLDVEVHNHDTDVEVDEDEYFDFANDEGLEVGFHTEYDADCVATYDEDDEPATLKPGVGHVTYTLDTGSSSFAGSFTGDDATPATVFDNTGGSLTASAAPFHEDLDWSFASGNYTLVFDVSAAGVAAKSATLQFHG